MNSVVTDDVAPTDNAAVILRRLGVHFSGLVALNNVSFEAAPGEIIGIIGPNGAGKTTLLNVVAGALAPSVGEVLLFGQRSRKSAVAQARLGVGRTFQQLSLFSELTVRDHVMFGYAAGLGERGQGWRWWSRQSRLERIAEADDSPLSPRAVMNDLGLTELADQQAVEQSVGVARMVDLARALVSRPRLLLLDEPVSGLSELESEAVGKVLLDLRAQHGMTMMVVEHNLEFARMVSERIIALDFGEVIAAGPSSEVLASERVRTAYFGTTDEDAGPDVSAEATISLRQGEPSALGTE
jgi:branched-chain amino acid transport system ATP-binding protein